MKRLQSVILILALLLGMATPALAVSTSDSLEEAVLLVRSVVDIPESMTEFYYDSYKTEYDGEIVTIWYLNWSDGSGEEQISAEADSLGNLCSYYRYVSSANTGLAKVTRAKGAAAAEAFIAKALPDLAADMRQINEEQNKTYTYRLSYTYQLYKNGIPVPFVQVQVYVDKYTGEVIGYYGLSAGTVIPATFETADVISLEAAKAAYLDGIGLTLKYYSSYDYSTKTLTVFPAYYAGNTSTQVIDAETGKIIDLYNAGYSYYGVSYDSAASLSYESAAGSAGLSDVERAAVDAVAGLISSEDAAQILRDKAEGITDDMEVYGVSFSQSYIERDKYIWQISFMDAYGTVDAKTGEILSFYIYGNAAYAGSKNLTYAQAQAVAEKFLKSEAAEKFADAKLSELSSANKEAYASGDIDGYSMQYYRQANGIDYVNNSLSVTVNKSSGMITRYSSTWYDSATFSSIASVISVEEAFDVFNSSYNLGLAYGRTAKDKAELVYQFENYLSFYVNPVTGGKLDGSGNAYTGVELLPEYTDIAGHWSEAVVKELVSNGYYLKGNEFSPDKAITQYEFLQYLYPGYSTDVDRFYTYMEWQGVVTAEEKNPNVTLTRMEAAKFMIRYLGLGLAGEQAEVFKNPFPDAINKDYVGYAALCKSLGIMQGSANGAFNGAANMTRAEAAAAIYRLLQVR